MSKENLIEVKMPKCTLFLTNGEMQQLLKHDPDIWKNSLQRGKSILRSRKQKAREYEKAQQEGYGTGEVI